MTEFEDFLLHVLIQLAVIFAAARAGAWLLGKLGQPQVVGEIVAGLMLGPSVLGRFAPDAVDFVFPADATIVFRVLSELGLVLFMFFIGVEFDFSHLRQVRRTAARVGPVLSWPGRSAWRPLRRRRYAGPFSTRTLLFCIP
jgi:Kef-type K+ transport system membrane component KefB